MAVIAVNVQNFFFGLLTKEARILFGFYCFSLLVGISRLLAFLMPSLKYIRQNENQMHLLPCCSGSTKIPHRSISLHFQSFIRFSIYCPGLLFVLRRRNKEKYVYSIFLKAEVPASLNRGGFLILEVYDSLWETCISMSVLLLKDLMNKLISLFIPT